MEEDKKSPPPPSEREISANSPSRRLHKSAKNKAENFLSNISGLPREFEKYFIDSPPEIQVISTSVTKSMPRDVIIHHVFCRHNGWEWHFNVQRHQLRDLYSLLKKWELVTRAHATFNSLTGSNSSSTQSERRAMGTISSRNLSTRKATGKIGKSAFRRTGSLSENAADADKKGLEMSTISNPSVIGSKGAIRDDADRILRSAEDDIRESKIKSNILKFNQHHQDLAMDRVRSATDIGFDDDEEREVIDVGGTTLEITPAMIEANKRLKRYQLIFLSPSFYRSDHDSLVKQRQIIQAYLTDAVQHPRNRVCPDLLVLFEISATSFVKTTGPSLMEGVVRVRCSADSSDRSLRNRSDRACCGKSKGLHCFCCVCFCFRKRMALKRKKRYWAVLKHSSLCFYEKRTDTLPRECVMFQPSTVLADQLSTTGSNNGALIVDSAWLCELKFDNQLLQRQWVGAIKSAMHRSPYVERTRFLYDINDTNSLLANEFGSHTCHAQWFVNGKDYYGSLYDAINNAKWQILLSGWFLSADTYLKRPISKYPESRIDLVIEKACQRGVKVYIMIFHEPKVMAHNSRYTLERFNKHLDHRGNLYAIRHADTNLPFFWSHHDKHVTIDQEVAYVGGIDITFGRYEDSHYRLKDDAEKTGDQLFPGKDYANPRIKDVVAPEKPLEDNPTFDRSSIPRMPWRDIHMCIKGTVALDVAWHFIQRWNYTRYANGIKHRVPAIAPSGQGSVALSWLDRQDVDYHHHNVNYAVENPRKAHEPAVNHLTCRVNRALTETSEGRVGIKQTTVQTHALNSMFVSRAMSPSGKHLVDSSRGDEAQAGIDLENEIREMQKVGRNRRSTIGEGLSRIAESTVAAVLPKSNKKEKKQGVVLDGADFSPEEIGNMPSHLRPSNIKLTIEVQEENDEDVYSSGVEPINGGSVNNESNSKRTSVRDRVSFLNSLSNDNNKNTASTRGIHRANSFKQKKNKRTSMIKIGEIPGARAIDDDNDGNDGHSSGIHMNSNHPRQLQSQILISSEEGLASKDLENQIRDMSIQEQFDGSEALSPQSVELLKEWGSNEEGHSRDNSESNTGDLHQCRCQVVRSYSGWTAGLSEAEDGIHDAYKQLIEGSQHYIYIENQFFVSACGDKDSVIQNTIANALFSRIMKAHTNEEDFRIYVVIPLVPGMTGAIKSDGMSGIACVMYFQYRTICHGGESLYERLERHNVDPTKYIFFSGLRTFEEFPNSMETEMVYIHSKLMIVDDRKAIIGSANINDRSLVGYKDSEIAVIVEDTLKVDGKMGGKDYKAGPFCRGLRFKCWFDNLGLKPGEKGKIEDPKCTQTWDFVLNRAKSNTKLYEKAFPGITPTNLIEGFKEWAASDQVNRYTEADKDSRDTIIRDTSHGGHTQKHSGKGSGSGKLSRSGSEFATTGMDKKGDDSERKMKRGLLKSQSIKFHNKKNLLSKDEVIEEESDTGSFRDGDDSFSSDNPMLDKDHHKHRTESCVEARSILSGIQGIIVEFPLNFLKNDYSRMKSTIVPSEIFK